MVKIFCDKCGADCDLNDYVLTVEVIHNPSPVSPNDIGRLKTTDDNTFMKMCLCQSCYGELKFPNIYEVKRTGKFYWKNYDKEEEEIEEYNLSDDNIFTPFKSVYICFDIYNDKITKDRVSFKFKRG